MSEEITQIIVSGLLELLLLPLPFLLLMFIFKRWIVND